MTPDFSKNHFALFQLEPAFEINLSALDVAYRDVQREVHPDRFNGANDAERRVAAQWATQANEAYKTLRSPLARGRYLLRLAGIDTEEESNTAMPRQFLMDQMEWREAVVDAREASDSDALDRLASEHRNAERSLVAELAAQLADLSNNNQLQAAKLTVRKLRFLEKLGEEIDLAQEAIEGA
jgi:molecular chaperone HscB